MEIGFLMMSEWAKVLSRDGSAWVGKSYVAYSFLSVCFLDRINQL